MCLLKYLMHPKCLQIEFQPLIDQLVVLSEFEPLLVTFASTNKTSFRAKLEFKSMNI